MAVHRRADFLKILEVMDVLSTSSDEDDDATDLWKYAILCEKNKIPKLGGFIHVINNYSDEEFRKNFRLRRDTGYALIERYAESDFRPVDSHGGCKAMSAESDMLTFMWFAGNKESLRSVAKIFGTCPKTVFQQCERVMTYLLSIAQLVIKFPEDLQQAAADFQEISGFPNVIGCIDGSFIGIRTPAHKIASTYVNRHDRSSITLQAICNAQRKFIDVFTGVPGKVHDARVFKLSGMSEKIRDLCDGTYHVLGDGAYPIREWLLVPFKDYGDLGEAQKKYNKKHSQTRVRIENSFGILKARFRQLSLQVDMHQVDKITKFIVSCCVLHNLCIDNVDFWEEEVQEINEDLAAEPQHVSENELKNLGETKRYRIMQTL